MNANSGGPLSRSREGWDEEFRLMAEHGDDRLEDEDSSQTEWDKDEWEW